MKTTIPHAEVRRKRWYAVLDVPAEVRHIMGKARLVQSTMTGDPSEAARRVSVLVTQWKADIAKARGQLPKHSDPFWVSLAQDHAMAREAEGDDDGVMVGVVEDLIKLEADKIADPDEAGLMYRRATGQAPMPIPLGPLVTAWKGSLGKLAQKTIDQANRDVTRMADHFLYLDALTPQKVLAWTEKMLGEGVTASSLERIGSGCRSFWSYLQQSGSVAMVEPNPFEGPFRLAQRRAVKNTKDITAFMPQEVADLYAAALAKEDQPLADLIALGAYSGGRIEELCSLTKETSKGGFFRMGTKTNASRRDCPVHPSVAPLVARLVKASTDGYLIPSAADNQYGNRSGPLSQRFGHLKKALGFGQRHVFHSTRHTLVTLMHQAGVPSPIISDVVGHEKGIFTLDKYGTGSSMAQKLEAIRKVSYPAPLNQL